MSVIIDTQILIWLFIDTKKIKPNIFEILKNLENEILVSDVSIWEIAIKNSIGKLILPFNFKSILYELKEININVLQIASEHIINLANLPFHHKDPFDRLIISQSMLENIPIISSDDIFNKYEIEVFW